MIGEDMETQIYEQIIKGKEHLHLKDVLQNIPYRSNKGDKVFLFLSCGYAVYGKLREAIK